MTAAAATPQRGAGGVRVGSEPGRQEPGAGAPRPRPAGHHPTGRRARRRDRREGQLQRRLPRDQRRGPRADHEASGDDDRVGRGAGVPTFGKDVPHPRAYGTFARVLGVYVREKQVLTLEEAVRKMSGFPAQRLGSPIAASSGRA